MTTPMVFYKYASCLMEDMEYYLARDCEYFGEKDELKKTIDNFLKKYNEEEYIITQFNNDVLTKKSFGDDFTEYVESIYIYNKKKFPFQVKEDGKCYYIHPCGEEELIEDGEEMENFGRIEWCIYLSSHYVNKKKMEVSCNAPPNELINDEKYKKSIDRKFVRVE